MTVTHRRPPPAPVHAARRAAHEVTHVVAHKAEPWATK